VELVIVVALLSIILTLTLPALRKLSGKSELQNAARQLRVTLLEARLAAIDSGQPVYFRYEPGGHAYEIEQTSTSSAEQISAEDLRSDSPPNTEHRTANTDPQTLPHGIWFADAPADGPIRESEAADGRAAEASWSAPIPFYPNGRTGSARIALVNRHYRVELNVRGLTGTVQVSPAERLAPSAQDSPEMLPEAAP
jgi:type II secretory pathway pseudopilin PulG